MPLFKSDLLLLDLAWKEQCDMMSPLTNLDHRAQVQAHLMNSNTSSSPLWFGSLWNGAYVCFPFCDEAEVRGRADHHCRSLKHITTDPPPIHPRHLWNLWTMAGQWGGNLSSRIFLSLSNGVYKPQHVHELSFDRIGPVGHTPQRSVGRLCGEMNIWNAPSIITDGQGVELSPRIIVWNTGCYEMANLNVWL